MGLACQKELLLQEEEEEVRFICKAIKEQLGEMVEAQSVVWEPSYLVILTILEHQHLQAKVQEEQVLAAIMALLVKEQMPSIRFLEEELVAVAIMEVPQVMMHHQQVEVATFQTLCKMEYCNLVKILVMGMPLYHGIFLLKLP